MGLLGVGAVMSHWVYMKRGIMRSQRAIGVRNEKFMVQESKGNPSQMRFFSSFMIYFDKRILELKFTKHIL